MRVLNLISFFFMFFLQNVDKVGPGFCPEYVRKAGSGIAADQTNAMLATSKGGDFPLCGRSPLFSRYWRNVAACSAVECLLSLAVKTAHSGSCGLERRSFALTQVSVSQACFQMQKAEKQ